MEIANLKRASDWLNWEDLRKMRYSWNVGSEVLRLAPPIHGAFREANEDITYDGYILPKGWELHWIADDTHKNPDCFQNPDKFDPTKFQGNGPAPYTFVPFGGGPRMCPGNKYFRMVALVFMHNVVTKFSTKLEAKYCTYSKCYANNCLCECLHDTCSTSMLFPLIYAAGWTHYGTDHDLHYARKTELLGSELYRYYHGMLSASFYSRTLLHYYISLSLVNQFRMYYQD